MKIRTLLLIIVLLTVAQLRAQKNVNVLYESIFKKNLLVSYSRLVANDSTSFFFYYGNKQSLKKDSLPYGKYVVHHALFIDKTLNICFQEDNLNYNQPLLITDTVQKFKWSLLNEIKKIKNYTCYKATTLKGADTITVWYTKELPVKAGPAGYDGLPGLILAYSDVYLTATAKDIKLDNFPISFPESGTQISMKAFLKLKD